MGVRSFVKAISGVDTVYRSLMLFSEGLLGREIEKCRRRDLRAPIKSRSRIVHYCFIDLTSRALTTLGITSKRSGYSVRSYLQICSI